MSRRFSASGSLNEWVAFLHDLYGHSQNYSRTTYEIHSHLTEICGVFAKHLFKRHDRSAAAEFLPKIFAWSVALLKVVRPTETDLEGIILRKFPGICPYCAEAPCACWHGPKPTINPE